MCGYVGVDKGKPFLLEHSGFVDTGLGVWFVVLCCCRDPSVLAALPVGRFPVRNG